MPSVHPQEDATTSSKFAAFDILDVSYKEVDGVSIPASILVPKSMQAGSHAVMVRWHGGGFVTGQRLFAEWMGDWVLDLALRQHAILVMPDYRLMPEATGLDILQDVEDFLAWLLELDNLSSGLPQGVDPDLDNVLVTGESAGGWLAIQSGIIAPSNVKAIIAHYPMVDLKDGHYTEDYPKEIFDPPMPQLDRSILSDHVAKLQGNEVVTSAIPPARGELFASMLQQGSFGRFFGDDRSLYPIEMLDEVEAVPPLWILHGKEDSVVPIRGTYRYAEQRREKHPDAKLHVSYRPGEHGFDNLPPASLEDGWISDGVGFIDACWPKR